jgi:formate dehydrogenase accessory protein FdhE
MRSGRWDERIARAQKLSADYSFAGEILRFYEHVAAAQKRVYVRVLEACGETRVQRQPGGLREELDLTILLPELGRFLAAVERHGPGPLATTAGGLAAKDAGEWVELLSSWWAAPETGGAGSEAQVQFCARAFLQPYAEYLAEHTELPMLEMTPSVCPVCGARPQLGVLRQEGDGASRSLECSLCATEWRYGRILCPACGESNETHLAIYIAEELPHVRVEACETCRAYIKTVDLTKTGLAVPLVDEIAAVPLDLWAAERDYTKLQTNLLGM